VHLVGFIIRIYNDALSSERHIIIIIIIIIISFTQGIYTYIPETNNVTREYSVAAILLFIHGASIVSFSVESIVLLR